MLGMSGAARTVVLLAAAGCGGAHGETAAVYHAPGPLVAATVPSSATATTPEAALGPRRVGLKFELNGRKFPLPLVRGTVSGEPVWMLVDTGANSHVIASWVARKVGLAMHPLGDVGSDHTGRA